MSVRPFHCASVAAAAVFALFSPMTFAAETIATLRVMLHPYTAPEGKLSTPALAKLEAIVGAQLTLTGTTRTGAFEFSLSEPKDEASAARMFGQLRNAREVLWAEPLTPRRTTRKTASSDSAAQMPGRRLLVRVKDGVAVDWGVLLPRLSARIGLDLKVERQIAHVWVLSVADPQSSAELARLAEMIQQDADIQYADSVKRVFRKAAPNDPLYSRQWSLTSPVAGINAEVAWQIQPNANNVTIAVIDTGILPHPDLEGRVLAGYDFISEAERARDDNGRDPDPRDEGDWRGSGECGPAQDSFFHGTFIAGQIAANTNNGEGIAGLVGGAKILPVRALGKCGGTFDDVLAAFQWAAGVVIAGVPANANPARVINLSLGGLGGCDQAIQDAINGAMAQGSVVVVAAGNEVDDALDYTPANCGGVITVGAHSANGDRTSYSNYGRRIDLTAPGGDLPIDDLIVSTANSGTTVPVEPNYVLGRGTSFAAPYVTGTAALMLARDPTLTAGRVLSILAGTTRDFPAASQCHTAGICGSGMLDAGAALFATIPGGAPPPPGTVRVVEYYRSDLDHYFMTADPAEMAYVDTSLRTVFQ
nr:S8 family peptidase [Betaproteobacteria bacterium]